LGDQVYSKKRDWTARAGQIIAIIAGCLIYYMLIYKGITDISTIAQSNPDSFWASLFQYLLANIGATS
jgi:hypothetical protein